MICIGKRAEDTRLQYVISSGGVAAIWQQISWMPKNELPPEEMPVTEVASAMPPKRTFSAPPLMNTLPVPPLDARPVTKLPMAEPPL